LVDRTQASRQARERAKVILLTLTRDVSVREGCERLGLSRTRFQDLRTRLLQGAVLALEGAPLGRPRKAHGGDTEAEALRRRIVSLERSLVHERVRVELAEAGLTPVLLRRLAARGGGR
jgi:hypothetical protein